MNTSKTRRFRTSAAVSAVALSRAGPTENVTGSNTLVIRDPVAAELIEKSRRETSDPIERFRNYSLLMRLRLAIEMGAITSDEATTNYFNHLTVDQQVEILKAHATRKLKNSGARQRLNDRLDQVLKQGDPP